MSKKLTDTTTPSGCLPVKVLKFGGTSVKSLARISHVADIVQASLVNGPLLVVLSAMGDSTDHLLDLAFRCCPKPDPRELDQLISTGEQVSISLLAMCLLSRGINARSYTAAQAGIFCDRAHGASTILNIDKDKLYAAFSQHSVVVVAGFQGLDSAGNINTLGRGGSDTSAVALAARLKIPCDIFTDVDGIFSADPNHVDGAELLQRIPSTVALALARAGAQVIHPRAVELARHYKVGLRVLNTFKPDSSGTTIQTGDIFVENFKTVWGVASESDICLVSITLPRERNAGCTAVVEHLADLKIACEVHVLSQERIDIATPQTNVAIIEENFDVIKSSAGSYARVSLIGHGLSGRLDIHAKLLRQLSYQQIEVTHLWCTEQKLTVLVDSSNRRIVEQLLHDEFVNNRRIARRTKTA